MTDERLDEIERLCDTQTPYTEILAVDLREVVAALRSASIGYAVQQKHHEAMIELLHATERERDSALASNARMREAWKMLSGYVPMDSRETVQEVRATSPHDVGCAEISGDGYDRCNCSRVERERKARAILDNGGAE